MKEQTLSQSGHWAEVIGQLTDKLTGKNMSMTYEFDNLTIDIPSARVQVVRTLVEQNGRLMVKLQLPQKPIKRAVLVKFSRLLYYP